MRSLLIFAPLLVGSTALAGPRWQADWSAQELSSTEAEQYCAARGENKGWRLPTKTELEGVRGTKLPADGYLWSGEDVSAERVGQRWILNLANRHIFNGDGRIGYAKCVRGPLPKRVERTLSPTYATIGPADAKLTVVVAVQPDYPWWKIRDTLDDLAAKHPVRFDLRPYIVWDKYTAAGVAFCAAAQAGTLGALEAGLRKDPRPKLDAVSLRAMALGGADGKAYDRAAKTCVRRIADDRAALAQRGVDATPTFFIGTTKVVGAKPDELTAAVEAAL